MKTIHSFFVVGTSSRNSSIKDDVVGLVAANCLGSALHVASRQSVHFERSSNYRSSQIITVRSGENDFLAALGRCGAFPSPNRQTGIPPCFYTPRCPFEYWRLPTRPFPLIFGSCDPCDALGLWLIPICAGGSVGLRITGGGDGRGEGFPRSNPSAESIAAGGLKGDAFPNEALRAR